LNPYEVLGLNSDATQEEIKKRYRQLAQDLHPDRGGDGDKFAQVNLAYDILNDPIMKRSFDASGTFFYDQTIYTEAKEQLGHVLWRQIDQCDPDHGDLILYMKNDARAVLKSVETDIQNTKNYLGKLLKIINKIKLKKNHENILATLVKLKINNLENDLKMFERRTKVCNVMLIVLDNYHFSVNEWMEMLEAPPPEANSQVSTP
jgi:curved DNA-binding protein CbpA